MLTLKNVSIESGPFVLSGVSFEVPPGSYAVLMGETGSGKTTLLEGICGLRPATKGAVVLNDVDVTRLGPAARGIGYVPQEAALFATMSVREQLGFSLLIRKQSRPAIAKRVAELAELLHIEALLDRAPVALSGGERQRVALGRALAHSPGMLLLDEPLSALDENARSDMYELLKSVQSMTGLTALHVTHSSSEANHLADVLFRLRAGRVEAVHDAAPGANIGASEQLPVS